MILHSNQKIVAQSKSRFRVLNCGRRWGKTTLSVEEMKGRAIFRTARIAYIAPTYQQARDIAWEMLKKELQPIATNINESRLEIRVPNKQDKESLIILRGWEAIESLRGQQFDFLILDEVASMRNFWIGWQEVLRPTLTDTRGDVMFVSTPKGYNHFYDLFNLELNDKDFKSFHFSSYDNPFLHVDELDKARDTLPKERFEQEYMASFQKTQGLVYKEFSRDKHLYETLPEGNYEKVAGVDFGFKNPAGVLDIRIAKERFYVEDEWYKRERTEEQIADYISAYKFDEVYPDPENPSAIEVLRRKNVNVREVIKGRDSIKSGINKVREMLITGKLKINKRCINLITELEMYSYDDEKGDRNEDENPIKLNDHLLDALRYVVMMKDTGFDDEQEKAERLISRLKLTTNQTR
jgi:PBSX family phage terminase large subunit